MVRKYPLLFFHLFLITSLVIAPVQASDTTVDQVKLKSVYTYAGYPLEINPDAAGNLIVSDDGGIIWKIHPKTGEYTLYDTTLTGLTDAHAVSGGYWFTNTNNIVAFFDSVNSYQWEFLEDGLSQADYHFGAVDLDAAGNVWIAEVISATSRLYRVTRGQNNTAIICPLIKAAGDPAYGTYAYDMVSYAGYLWYYNHFADWIVRFNPVPDINQEFTLDFWPTGILPGSIEGRGIQFDDSGSLWISGGGSGTILRFNPATNLLDTFTVPVRDQVVPSIEGVTVNGSQIWYADLKGSVGVLDMAAPHTITDLSNTSGSLKLKFASPCASIPAVVVPLYTSQSGTLSFTERTVTPDTSHPGWMIYPLTTDDHLAGIKAAQEVVLVSETNISETPHFGQILRFKQSAPDEYKVFLPLIRR
jgi:streptogramin lyase